MKGKKKDLVSSLSILNAMQGPAAVLDKDGNVILSNEHWGKEKNHSHWFEIEPHNDNYIEHCRYAVELGNDYALHLLFGIREILQGQKESLALTISATPGVNKQWHKVEISKLENTSKDYVLLVFSDISEDMKSVKELRDSEAKYKQYFQQSTDGIILGKPNGEILDANPAACQILGYSKPELMEGGRALILDESDPAHLEVVRTRDDNSFFTGEKEYIHKDGHYIPVQLTSFAYTFDDGTQQIINTFRDIQKEKKNKFTLEEERRFSKTALNSIPGIFFVLNADNHFIRWSDSMLTVLGHTDESILELTIYDIFHDSEHEKLYEVIQGAFITGSGNFSGRIITGEDECRFYNLQINKFESNDKNFLVATGVDMTDFVESEKKREKNYQLMTELFDNSPIAKVMINPHNEVQKMNQAFINLFEYSAEKIMGNNINKLISCVNCMDEAEEITKAAFKGKADQRKTVRIKKDGTKVPVLITTVPVRNNGEIISVYGIYVDLTEQRKLENHLQKSLHEKDILLQEVHHRVKNNLAIIASLLELQIIHDSNEESREQLRHAYNRIFSIAKIHETLYNYKEIAEISFDDYLATLVDATPILVKAEKFKINLHSSGEPLILNINQAVPLALLLNELVNLGSSDESGNNRVELSYKNKGNDVSMEIKGIDKQIEEFYKSKEEQPFQHLLIKTFIEQIDANVTVVKNSTNKLSIKFQKSDTVKGASSSLTKQVDGFSKSNLG
ncbi:PAS domain S-box protein [Rhodohalobacter sp. 614A]|uniref:PAS domain S-box protein n=1 Tax=Rhodohalobacter sp. 614A TaxID=2908649 RepID=UPI001F20F66E|nr:PAS domain S-box protein [Rhodohalobacter sp. 614A]